jgi:NADPH-dependent ferric siderophore reductase
MQPATDAERNASYLARPRRRPAPLRATVSEKTQLSLHLVRVTLTGPDLAGFNYPGPASHFKLVLPDPDVGELLLPTPGDDGLVTLDGAPSLIMRTFHPATAVRPDTGTVGANAAGDGWLTCAGTLA